MWSRKRIDIRWADLMFGFRHSFICGDRQAAVRETEASMQAGEHSLACLSVRSGFDLLWTELQLPVGSEVLMSAVTIRDMSRIVEEHGLVPVPVDLDPGTMKPNLESLRRSITPKTRAIVVAHLFGAILNLDDIIALAKEHHLLFIEDCAQAFDGLRYCGHPAADVVMFSFGPIKTATALAGGLLMVRTAELLQRMRKAHESWPEQSQSEFRHRIKTYSILKLVSGRFAFACLVRLLRVLRKDLDATLNGAVRNFPAESFFISLRRQPCVALLKLMNRRISTFDAVRQDRRCMLGKLLNGVIHDQHAESPNQKNDSMNTPLVKVPGHQAKRHTWWVFPVCSTDPQAIIDTLRIAGFDATCGSQLQPVDTPAGHEAQSPGQAADVIRTMYFLPFYPEMSERAVMRMGNIVATMRSDILK